MAAVLAKVVVPAPLRPVAPRLTARPYVAALRPTRPGDLQSACFHSLSLPLHARLVRRRPAGLACPPDIAGRPVRQTSAAIFPSSPCPCHVLLRVIFIFTRLRHDLTRKRVPPVL